MRPHDGAVEHRIFVVGIGGEMLEELLPDPGFGPPTEPAMGILPVAEARRQIAPRDASAVAIEHCFDESTIVLSGRANMTDPPRQPILDPLPLVVAQSISRHGSAFCQSRPSINHIVSGSDRLALRSIPNRRLVLRAILQ